MVIINWQSKSFIYGIYSILKGFKFNIEYPRSEMKMILEIFQRQY
jgi:hypothetical protein